MEAVATDRKTFELAGNRHIVGDEYCPECYMGPKECLRGCGGLVHDDKQNNTMEREVFECDVCGDWEIW